jgi:L-asparaginase/Glu-tRNA(Gln) amidotransferase subunit D
MQERVLLIRTGGTVDSERYEDPYNPPKIVNTLKGNDSLVMPTVRQMDHSRMVDGFTWLPAQEDRFVKDSQEFEFADITALAEIIRKDDHRSVVVTHGTDGMVHNCKIVAGSLGGHG